MTRAMAVRKASKARLLGDMRRAAKLVEQTGGCRKLIAEFFILGAVEASGSASVAACLMTAFGK